MGALLQLGLGALFGIALFTSGASDFDAMLRMFHFQEAHLFALAAMTTCVAWLGLRLLLRSPAGEGVRAMARPIHRGSVAGGVVFGVGWGLSGSCPGTVLAQLGAGHVIALVTAGGVLLGNWIFERWFSGRYGLAKNSCN
ncbi:MAG TPA: DUF6691 family protein [Polyangiaceae bacterium]